MKTPWTNSGCRKKIQQQRIRLGIDGRLTAHSFRHAHATHHNSYEWKEFKNSLYEKDWCPYIKQTFNGFGNAIEYLGRYTHKTAISNSRILSVSETETVFSARGKMPDDPKARFTGRSMAEILKIVWNVDVHICPICGNHSMKLLGRMYVPSQ